MTLLMYHQYNMYFISQHTLTHCMCLPYSLVFFIHVSRGSRYHKLADSATDSPPFLVRFRTLGRGLSRIASAEVVTSYNSIDRLQC